MDRLVRRWYLFARKSESQKQLVAPVAGFLVIGIIFVGVLININIQERINLTNGFHQASITLLLAEQQSKIEIELRNFELSNQAENLDYAGRIKKGEDEKTILPLQSMLRHSQATGRPVTGFARLSGKIVLLAVHEQGNIISYVGRIIDQKYLNQFADRYYFDKLELIDDLPEQPENILGGIPGNLAENLFVIANYLDYPIGYIRHFSSPGLTRYILVMVSALSITIGLMALTLLTFGLRIRRILDRLRTKTQQLDLKTEAVRLSHSNLSLLFDCIREPILTVDADGVITYCNGATSNLFKCSADALIGQLFAPKILHQKKDRSGILGEELSKLSAHDKPLVRLKGYKSDNSPIMMELSVNNFPSLEKAGYVIAITDLTEQNRDEDLINLVNSALILVDKDARIIIANQPAKKIFGELDGLKVEAEKLVSQRDSDTRRIHDLISKALSGWGNHGYKSGAMRLFRPSGALPYSLVVLPFQAGTMPENHEIAVVIVNDPEKKISYSSELLQRIYKLTNTEAVVASALGQGLTLDRISQQLNISKNTVRNHLKNIFRKTGTTRQADLVNILMMNAAFSGIGCF